MLRITLFTIILGLTALPITSKDQPEVVCEPIESSEMLFQNLKKGNHPLPDRKVFDLAYDGWTKLQGTLSSNILTIIDFSLPSTEKRMWIIDPEAEAILSHTVVSHGRNSGDLMATEFSNRPESFKSSLGFYKTAETYYGKHGYSLKLDGLEEEFNGQARERAIVIHGSDYAREEFALRTGRLGRSLGCPAVPKEISKELIDLIKEGSLIFAYGIDEGYLTGSEILNS